MTPKITIITSEKDIAGVNMKNLLKKYGVETIHINEDIINPEDIDKKYSETEFFIFASRHKSSKPYKTLTVHPIGNWNKAEYGGKEKTSVLTNAIMNKSALRMLKGNAECHGTVDDRYDTTMECTHHGPYISKPCLFIEVGGSEEEWNDHSAIEVIVETIVSIIMGYEAIKKNNKNYKSAIGVGGLHYCQSFNQIQLNSEDYALGHVIPKYALPISENMINEAINKTLPKPEIAIIDYKGLGKAEDRDETIKLLKEAGLEIIRTSEIKKEANNEKQKT